MALKIAGPGKVDKAFCCSAGSVPNGTASMTGTLSVNLFTVPVHLRIHHQPPRVTIQMAAGLEGGKYPRGYFCFKKAIFLEFGRIVFQKMCVFSFSFS